MNLLFWKKNNVIDAFANELANELFSTIQPSVAKTLFEGSSDKKQMKKTEKKWKRRSMAS